MIRKTSRRVLALILSLSMALPTYVFAIPYDEYMSTRYEYTSVTYDLSEGLTYTEKIGENGKYGIERSFIFEYTPMMGTDIVISGSDYVYGTKALGSIAESYEKDGKRVVGGINGDFYDMATGVPLGAMIVDGEIVTSDCGYTAMGFDSDGKAFISKPQFVTTLAGKDKNINIGHINKMPNEYSLFLLTDKFHKTTRSTKPATEYVLVPYSDEEVFLTEEDVTPEEEGKKYLYIYSESKEQEKTEEDQIPLSDNETSVKEPDGAKDSTENADKESANEGTDDIQPTGSSDISVISDENKDDEIKENTESDEGAESDPEQATDKNGGKASTDNEKTENEPDSKKSSEETEEYEEKEPEVETTAFYAKRYTVSDRKLTVGCEINVIVSEVRENVQNTEIPEGCFVLTAETDYQLYLTYGITQGESMVLSVKGGEEWENAVNAIGVYGGYILRDGEYCDDVEVNHYPYAHPRTAAGITEDGRVIFYCVDGRQELSGGLRIDQLSHEMKKLGCVVAVNFDGGGSTTAYAALPGEKSASIKNSPSGNSERKTANSILFINSQEKEGHPSVFTLSPQKPYIVSGGSEYTFGRPAVSDHSGYPADIETEWQYEYLLDPSQTDSVIRDGVTFVSGDKCGEVDIYVRIHCNGCFVEQHAGTVYVMEQPEKFTFGKDSYEISPFESINFALDYEYHTAKIFCDKNSLRWKLSLQNSNAEVEEVIADISESVANKESQDGAEVVTTDGVVSEPPASENEIDDPDAPYAEEPLIEDIQVPNADGNAEATATDEAEETQQAAEEEQKSHNDFYKIEKESFFDTEMFTLSDELVLIPKVHGQSFILNARIGNLEKSTTINVKKFPYNDSFEHWSAPYLYDVHEYSLMQGETDGTEMAFRPERNLTKAEFFTILARIINPYIDAEELAETEDSAVSEGNEPFEETQEQNDVDAVAADGIPETSDELSAFADRADIPGWAEKYFNALSSTGMLDIIASDDGTGIKYLKPSEYITRLEVLRVLGALCNEAQADFVSAFADGDVLYDDIYYKFINNAIAIELFAGYEDGTLRPYELLTRAQAATVILRFYNAPKM